MTLGQRLKALRVEKKLTQKKLSGMLNIANSTLSLYESDERKPDYGVLKRFSEFFDVSVDYLLGFTEIRNAEAMIGSDEIKMPRDLDFAGLPEDAVKQIDDYIQFIKEKYSSYSNANKNSQ